MSDASTILSAARTGNYRLVICALLVFATTVHYMDRQTLPLIKPMLDEQLGWTNERQGNVTVGYTIPFGICGSACLATFANHHRLAPKLKPLKPSHT